MKKTRILIVEDESIIGEDLKRSLLGLGFDVPAAASTGEDAVMLAETHRPDLVLMDITLQGAMNGVEAAKIIKDRFAVPVVYVTGLADVATVIEARRSEPYGYIVKPVSMQDLFSTIDTALRRHSLEKNLEQKTAELEATNEELNAALEELEATNEELSISLRDLEAKEEKYRVLFESMAQGVVYQSADGKIISANPAAEKILGLTLDQMQGRTSIDPRWKPIHEDGSAFPGDSHPAMEALRTGKEVRNAVMGVYNPVSGSYAWININATPLFRPGEREPFQVFTTFDDITHRMTADRELRGYAAQLSSIFRAAPVGIGVVVNRVFQRVNDRLCEMLGYARDELLGQGARMIYPSDEEYEFVGREKYRQISEQGTGSVETRWLRKDGRVINVILSSTPLNLSDLGAGVTFTALDITKRKKAEEALRATLREKELMFKEIHHRVKNNFQIITSMLNLQSGRIRDPELLDIYRDSANRIRAMSLVHERLYMSPDLTRVDFAEYIKTISHELYHGCWRSLSEVALDIRAESIGLSVDKAIPCGLIINEILTNALKYAFPAGWSDRPVIEIRFAQLGDGRLELRVSDNGVGIPEDVDLSSGKTLGLSLVDVLSKQLDAELVLERAGGSSFRLRFMQ